MGLKQLSLEFAIIFLELPDVLSVIISLLCHFLHLELELFDPLHLPLKLVDVILPFIHFGLQCFEFRVGGKKPFLQLVDQLKVLLLLLTDELF